MDCPLNKEKSCQVCEFSKESLCDYPYIGNVNMDDCGAMVSLVKCEKCEQVMVSRDAFSHSLHTGHNSWSLIGGRR